MTPKHDPHTDLRARVVAGEDVPPEELAKAVEAQHAARLGLIHALANKGKKKGSKRKAKVPVGEKGLDEQVKLEV